MLPPHRNLQPSSAPAPWRQPPGLDVVYDEPAEDAYADVEWDRERNVVQHTEAGGEVSYDTFVEDRGASAHGLRQLALLMAKDEVVRKRIDKRGFDGTRTWQLE